MALHTLVVTLSRSSTLSQLLVDDPSKRAIYTDAHTSCMIPRWRDMAAIIATKLALIEAPPVGVLAAANPSWSAVDWAKISSGTLTVFLFDMVTFADAWAAIEQRWTDGDYSVRTRPILHLRRHAVHCHVPYSLAHSRVRRVASPQVMQPTSPSPERIVFWITMVMTGKAAVKEEELQVATPVSDLPSLTSFVPQ